MARSGGPSSLTPDWPEPPIPANAPNVVVLDDLFYSLVLAHRSTAEHRRPRRRWPALHELPCDTAVLSLRRSSPKPPPSACRRVEHEQRQISDHAATMAEVHDEGYSTFAVGKCIAPMEQCSAAGPYDQWPLQRV